MSDPVVTLAGKDYPVPYLVPFQQRSILPALMRLNLMSDDMTKITTPLYDDIMLILYWGAIWPNDNQADQGFLLRKSVKWEEILAALTVIRKQTGLFSDVPKTGDSPSGEARSR